MDSIMINFDVDKPLPSVIVIKCAENHLYRNGLSSEMPRLPHARGAN